MSRSRRDGATGITQSRAPAGLPPSSTMYLRALHSLPPSLPPNSTEPQKLYLSASFKLYCALKTSGCSRFELAKEESPLL